MKEGEFGWELSLLKRVLRGGLWELAVKEKAILAGGMLTRIFTKEGGGDLDFFFTTKEHADSFVLGLDGYYPQPATKDREYAALFTQEGKLDIHVVFDPVFPNGAKSVIDDFDLSICMAAYDFGKEDGDGFVFGDTFLQDVQNREFTILKPLLAFPVHHLIRITKYLNRGYRLLNPEILDEFEKEEKMPL